MSALLIKNVKGAPGVRRIMRGRNLVGYAMKMPNGRWAAYANMHVCMSPRRFDAPEGVASFFSEHHPERGKSNA